MAYVPAPLVAYSTSVVPRGFPLNNTGTICYFNTMIQSLASCPGFTQTVANHIEYLTKTHTGSALHNFVQDVIRCASTPMSGHIRLPNPDHSALVLSGLLRDLKSRKPKFDFGKGMDSAAIALDLLLDMSEPESAKADGDDRGKVVSDQAEMIHKAQAHNPIASLFRLRVATKICCKSCEALGCSYEGQPPGIVSVRKDTCYSVEYFNYDIAQITDHESFTRNLLAQATRLDDYSCEKCEKAGRPTANLCARCASNGLSPQGACEGCKKIKKAGGDFANCERCVEGGRPGKCDACAIANGNSVRRYEIEKIPTILFIRFNQYVGHKKRFFPTEMYFNGKEGGKLRYSLVAQMEHSGSLTGGHYWAHGVRKSTAGDKLVSCSLNDVSVNPVKLGPTAATYCVVYHYIGVE